MSRSQPSLDKRRIKRRSRFFKFPITRLLPRSPAARCPHSIFRAYPSDNNPFGVYLKPFSPSKDMILTIVVHAFTLATAANFGLSPFKVHCTVIVRGNDNLSFATKEAQPELSVAREYPDVSEEDFESVSWNSVNRRVCDSSSTRATTAAPACSTSRDNPTPAAKDLPSIP
jgi:hypothetical protein